ncbi:MAG: hypothetical protein Q8P03_01080, partial [bacterium]|nr:hypothetical protein [bacterium]
LEEELAPWRESAKPLVVAGGDRYKKDGIQARITRTDKYISSALRLLEEEGELIWPLLSISSSEMKGAVGVGGILKGRLEEMVERKIVVVEAQTPRLIVEKV